MDKLSEGKTHAHLINSVSDFFKIPIFSARIYANELCMKIIII